MALLDFFTSKFKDFRHCLFHITWCYWSCILYFFGSNWLFKTSPKAIKSLLFIFRVCNTCTLVFWLFNIQVPKRQKWKLTWNILFVGKEKHYLNFFTLFFFECNFLFLVWVSSSLLSSSLTESSVNSSTSLSAPTVQRNYKMYCYFTAKNKLPVGT